MSLAYKCDVCGGYMEKRTHLETYAQAEGLYVVVKIQTSMFVPSPLGHREPDLCLDCVKRVRRQGVKAIGIIANPSTPLQT